MLFGGESLGKTLIFFGVILIVIGILLHFGGKFFPLGRLPGDIHVERETFSFYFPVVTCIIISIVLTVILNIFIRR